MNLDNMRIRDYLMVLIKGTLLGITSVGIPGLSASTLSIVLGIYFIMINSIADIFKNFKRNIKFVAPLLIGFLIGVGIAAYTITILLDTMPFFTTFAIVGLILSSIPNMIYKLRKYFKKPSCILTFLIIFALLTSYNIIRPQSTSMEFPEKVNFVFMLGMAVIGMFAAATFIIPGIDFAIIMLSLGIYYPFMNMIKGLLDFSNENYFSIAANNCMILSSFLIGLLIGLAVFSKLIKHLSKKYSAQTQFASLAFVISAPFVLIKTCLIDSGDFIYDKNQIILLIITLLTAFIIFFAIRFISLNINRAIITQADLIEAESYKDFLEIKNQKEKKKKMSN